ncbi:hypothetical protein GpartN1_g5393.t1 [Galdieria partita]|uniref:Uncharacterized protein n=1 Tax=Galdieria partita TaxID=83374 RepID=A0A9C7Q1R8_9RHOD|nr:hypothetical protein GpartN1_g5393.t1 [Galdieria partita]
MMKTQHSFGFPTSCVFISTNVLHCQSIQLDSLVESRRSYYCGKVGWHGLVNTKHKSPAVNNPLMTEVAVCFCVTGSLKTFHLTSHHFGSSLLACHSSRGQNKETELDRVEAPQHRHRSTRKPYGYWRNIDNLLREIQEFRKSRGEDITEMPCRNDILDSARLDLDAAILKRGGYEMISRVAKLKLSHCKERLGDWDIFREELLSFIKEHVCKDREGIIVQENIRLPTPLELRKYKRSDLFAAIEYHGGFWECSKRLGIPCASLKKPCGFWSDTHHVERELEIAARELNLPEKVMPTQSQLRSLGRLYLWRGIAQHGGAAAVAKELGWKILLKPHKFWKNFEHLERELVAFIENSRLPRVMPTQKTLRAAGRYDIIHAIYIHGGSGEVAKRLNLPFKTTQERSKRTPGIETTWRVVRRELRRYLAKKKGNKKIMPTEKELIRRNRTYLLEKIHSLGGIRIVGERLGLNCLRYWNNVTHVLYEVRKFVQEKNLQDRMPTERELLENGEYNLRKAILRFGYVYIARRSGLVAPAHWRLEPEELEKLMTKYSSPKALIDSIHSNQ